MRLKLYQCGGENSVAENPLGLGYLLSNCLVSGCTTEIVKSRGDLVDCDMIGLSSTANGLREAIGILENTSIPVTIGGQGTLWKPLQDYPFKHIVLGEGEGAFRDIMSGVVELHVVQYPPWRDLDTLEFPARGRCDTIVPMMTSRGCPYSCGFCSSAAFWRKPRYHSAEYFMSEVECIAKRYPKASLLYIQDDLFCDGSLRMHNIHNLWMKGAWSKRFKTKMMARATCFDERTARMAKDMNAVRVRFGAESGSDRMLRMLSKGTTVATNQRAIDAAKRVGVPITASFMHGCPGETEEDRKLTREFIARNPYLRVEGWYKFVPFPGSAMYDGSDPLKCNMEVR